MGANGTVDGFGTSSSDDGHQNLTLPSSPGLLGSSVVPDLSSLPSSSNSSAVPMISLSHCYRQ